MQAKVDGVLGDHPMAESTASDYRWRLRVHLLSYFGHLPLTAIDRRKCQEFKAYKLGQAVEVREALEAGWICAITATDEGSGFGGFLAILPIYR